MSFTKDKLAHLWGKITGLMDIVNDDIKDLNNNKVTIEPGKSLISDTEIERLSKVDNYDDTTVNNRLNAVELTKANKSEVYTKNETDKQITDEIAKIVADAPEEFDTLKEMSDWIYSHTDSAAEMNSAINQNTANISTLQNQVGKKVDKVDGKGLSTHDFDDTYKSKLDNLGDASTKTVTTTVDTSANLPTSSAVKTYVDESIASSGGGGASSSYLGTITELSSLSSTAKKGSFYRVSVAWEGVHVNDTIMAEKDNPEQNIDGVNWSLLHNEENTDESVTSVSNHYIPTKTETISAADGKLTDITNSATGTQVVTGVEMDAAGHITGVTSVALKASGAGGSGVDRYIDKAAFNDDSTLSEENPLKMTLTRVGEENEVEVIANLPKVSSSTAGVVPKGTDVTEQTTTTKFLREDGSWSIPSYPTTLPASDTTDEYSSEGTTPVSGKAVAAAIGTLDAEGEASINAGKTIVSWTQSNGIVNITTQDISITKSQISDFPETMTPSEHNQSSNTINAMTDYEKAITVSPITVDDSLNVAIGKLEKSLDEKQPIGDYANANHTHDEYVNQNAFSNITVGETTVEADTTTDTLTFASGDNITIVADASSDKIVISAIDTTYDVATQSKAGLMSSGDKTKLDGIEEGANNYALPEATTSTLGGVKTGDNITNTNGTISIASKNVTDALGYTPIDSELKGANNGVATLDENGKVLSTQLPTVDSVVTENSDNTVKSSGIYEYVNSSISTNTAYFRGTFDNIDALNAYSGTKTLNDYAFVKSVDEAGNSVYSRYKWNGDAWGFEYNLNNSSFTAEQWATINSGMANDDKTKLDGITAEATKTEASETNGNIKINDSEVTVYTHPAGTNPHGTTKSDIGLSNVPNVSTNNQTPSYTESSTLTKLTSGEKLSVAFGKISKAVTDLISHIADTTKHITSAERTTWNNAQANVIETVKVNNTALTPSSKSVNITVPTKVSELTNDSGFKTTDNNTTYSLSKSGSTITLTGSDGSTTSVTDSNSVTGVKGNSESSYRKGNINITPTNIGLGNVGNFKAVSTVASQPLTDTEKKNARDNIGAGTSSFSGDYNDLTNQPVIDDALSDTSTNAVQNKVIKTALDSKANSSDIYTKTEMDHKIHKVVCGKNATFGWFKIGETVCNSRKNTVGVTLIINPTYEGIHTTDNNKTVNSTVIMTIGARYQYDATDTDGLIGIKNDIVVKPYDIYGTIFNENCVYVHYENETLSIYLKTLTSSQAYVVTAISGYSSYLGEDSRYAWTFVDTNEPVELPTTGVGVYATDVTKAKYDGENNVIADTYVIKEENKGLSSNDFTDTYKNQIDTNKNNIATNTTNITTNKTNITTIAKHVKGELTDSDFHYDNATQMTKTVPTGMGKYAAVKSFTGKTTTVDSVLKHAVVDSIVSKSSGGTIIATMPIPDSIKALPDYGVEGNVVDFETMTYTQNKTITNGAVTALSSPKTTTITEMLFPIRCEAGGTITLQNSNNLSMPNTVIYKKEMVLNE